ncbi:MAG TPA: efflux RND transporter periplasmic adaptor subunit [Xanthobacteraceae bacterium]|jgi:cobalt-zinc-cadmium efflux system membrane fusion protein|nr:efflux RND transporter periplasmic adaptor subunit [Xanthobacteraceae bacterium]
MARVGFVFAGGALLAALLHISLVASAGVAAQGLAKKSDIVRVTNDQMHQLGIVKVELYPFRVQKLAIGQIAYNEDTSTAVLTPFPGRVTRLIAKIGDNVNRGDPLFEIDSPEVVQPQNDFIAAFSAMNKARSQLDLARIVEKRLKDLYEGKAAALKEYQQAQGQLVGAQNDMRSAEMSLEAARARLRIVGFTDAEVAALKEKGTVRRATPIPAPIDGTVIARKVGPGQYVRNDTGEALYVIADLSTMWLKAQVPEKEISSIRVGQDVEVKVSALPDRVLRARVTAINAATDATTRRVIVRSEIPNPEGALKSEMFASFKIATGDDEPSPSVPVQAVIREGDHAVVWVEEEPMLFRRRKVTLGIEQEGRMQIREGLKAGELVAGRGAIFVDNEWRQ